MDLTLLANLGAFIAFEFYHRWWKRYRILFTPRTVRFAEQECGVARRVGA